MKTAISLPDSVFERAEQTARRLQMSRSEFYAAALQAYLEQMGETGITARLDEVYSRVTARVPPEVQRAQTAVLPEERW